MLALMAQLLHPFPGPSAPGGRSFWVSGEPELWGCEEEDGEEGSQMSLHVENGAAQAPPGVLCALHLGETRPESKGRGRNAGIYLSRRTLRKNNTYLGAFRNGRTRPTELLNQFGGDTPLHTLGRSRDTGRGQSSTSHQGTTSHPGGLQAAAHSQESPPARGGDPVPWIRAEQRPSKVLTLG